MMLSNKTFHQLGLCSFHEEEEMKRNVVIALFILFCQFDQPHVIMINLYLHYLTYFPVHVVLAITKSDAFICGGQW